MDLTQRRRRVPQRHRRHRRGGQPDDHRHRHRTQRRPARRTRPPDYRVTGRRVLRSEWAKFWSLRSTWITLGVAAAPPGRRSGRSPPRTYSPAAALRRPSARDRRRRPRGQPGPVRHRSSPHWPSACSACWSSAGEYTTGMIRSTLAAVPRRLPVLWSKAAVFGLVALVVDHRRRASPPSCSAAASSRHGEPIAMSLGDDGRAAQPGSAPGSTWAWSACSASRWARCCAPCAGGIAVLVGIAADRARPGRRCCPARGTTTSPRTCPATRASRVRPDQAADVLVARGRPRGLRRLGGADPGRRRLPARARRDA